MQVLACYNIKGGVGKTATAVNLAYLSAEAGQRTLVWDLDPQGAATFYFRVKPKRGGSPDKMLAGRRDPRTLIKATDFPDLDLIRARFSFRDLDLAIARAPKTVRRLRRVIAPLAEDYDRLVFDCAPGINLTAESVFHASDALLVPTIPTPLSLRTLTQLVGHLERSGPAHLPVLPFFSMVDVRKSMHRALCESPGLAGVDFLPTRIPYASAVERMGIRRAPLFVFANATTPARAYRALWSDVTERLATS